MTPFDSYYLHMPQVITVRIDGPALRGLRTRRGLTVTQLAAKVGRFHSSVRNLEVGNGKLASLVFANQLANALETGLEEFTLPEDAEDADSSTEGAAAA